MAGQASKEAFVELQGRLMETDRKMKQMLAQERAKETQRKRAYLTLQELESLPVGTPTFSVLGKAFVVEPLDKLKVEQEESIKECDKAIDVIKGTVKYLERQLQEIQDNFKDLMQQSPSLVQQLMEMQAK